MSRASPDVASRGEGVEPGLGVHAREVDKSRARGSAPRREGEGRRRETLDDVARVRAPAGVKTLGRLHVVNFAPAGVKTLGRLHVVNFAPAGVGVRERQLSQGPRLGEREGGQGEGRVGG